MAYPGQFHRLVMIGKIFTEDFNVTLAIVPTVGLTVPPVSDTLLAGVAAKVDEFWRRSVAGLGIGISTDADLFSIKLNRIGPDGRYVDATAREHLYAGGVPAPGPGGQPAQIATVYTLRGADERALAGKGRMYMPPSQYTYPVASDGRMSAANAAQSCERFHSFLQEIGGIYNTASIDAYPGIASRTRGGAFQPMVRVTLGRVPDTMRSRRSSLPEDPVAFPPYPA